MSSDFDTRREIDRLTRRITELEQVIASVTTPPDREREDEEGSPIRDQGWRCSKCSTLLGFYDLKTDVLRVRLQKNILYVHVGDGGWIQSVCPRCGEPNIQEYASQEEVDRAAAAAGVLRTPAAG